MLKCMRGVGVPVKVYVSIAMEVEVGYVGNCTFT